MENTEIWNKARSLKLGKEFLNGLDELLTSLESDNKQLIITDVIPTLFCGKDVKTCIFYDKGKCKHDEFECRDQVTK